MKRSTLILVVTLLALIAVSISSCSSSPAGAGGANAIVINPNIQPVCPNNVICLDAGQQLVLNAILPAGGAVRVSNSVERPEGTATGTGITWKITSGPGSLTNASGTSVTFQAAPPTQVTSPAMTTITATSTTNASQTGSVTVTTNPTPTVTTTSLTAATEFAAVSGEQVTSSGGSGHKLFALAGGTTPPAGLTLNSDGSVTGTPTGPKGNFNFQVTVTDGATPAVTSPPATISITINWPSAPAITPSSLPNAPQGSAYSQSISVNQGHAPYTLAFSTAPPANQGLTYTFSNNNSASASLAITGTPTVASGTVINFTLQVTDSSNPAQVAQFPLSITVAQASPLTFSGSTLPAATDGTAYPTQSVSASGGLQPYTYTVTGGALPHGMNGAQSGNSFQFMGTPNDVAKMYSLTVQVKDSSNPSQMQSATFNLTVNAAPPVALTPSAAALPGATVNNFYSQDITASGGIPPYSFTITNNTLPGTLTISPGNGPGSGANSAKETISGTPTAAETGDGVTIEVSDSSLPTAMTKTIAYTLDVTAVSACVLAGKQAAYEMTGTDATGAAVELGSVTVGPDGSVSGALDFRNQNLLSANQSISGGAGSCKNGAVANTGTLTFTAGGVAHTLDFSIPTNFGTGAVGHVIEKDFNGAGQFQLQDAPTASLQGSRAFGVQGFNSANIVFAIGAVCLDSTSTISFLQSDFSVNGLEINMVAGNGGKFSAPDSNGRSETTTQISYTNGTTLEQTAYVLNGHKAFVMVSSGNAPGLGALPPEAGFLSGAPGSNCLPTGQGGSFNNGSLGPSTFVARGVGTSGTGTPFVGMFSGAVLTVNSGMGTFTYELDENLGGTTTFTGVQSASYSIPAGNNGRGTLTVLDNKGRPNVEGFYLDGNGNGYIIFSDHNGNGIAFGVVRKRSATTVAPGTFAFGTQLLVPVPGVPVLGVTQVQITANTVSDLAAGGSSGNYSCDGTGRCTTTSPLNNNVTFGDTSVAFYVNGNADSSTTTDEINVIQLTAPSPTGGALEE